MKALVALIVIYIGTFFLVIQGSPQNSVQASQQSSQNNASAQSNPNIDRVKEATSAP